MAEQDCTIYERWLVNKFFTCMQTAKAQNLEPDIDPDMSEEQEFLARMDADVVFDVDVLIPKDVDKQAWIDDLKFALHRYISNTERDTSEHHDIIESIKLVSRDG